MSTCADMKGGDVYKCDFCGLELEVKTACTCSEDDCGCAELACCNSPMSRA